MTTATQAGPAAPARYGATPPAPSEGARRLRAGWWWAAALAAAVPGAVYVFVAPPSRDLAAALYRTWLFGHDGFALWDNGWYSGHHLPGYSVLFAPVAWLLTPRLAAALAALATAGVFAGLAGRQLGDRAGPGVVLFGLATAVDLYTGRLALAIGALPATGAIALLDRRRTALSVILAALAALCSPVAGLFTAVAAGGDALGRRSAHGIVVAAAALAPIGALALAFPEGGTEPFQVGTLVPVLIVCVGAGWAARGRYPRIVAGVTIYGLLTLAAFVIPSPLGSNVARLGTLLGAPLAALLWWRLHPVRLAVAILPLLYVGFQAPVADVAATTGDPSLAAGYYRPLTRFLARERALDHGVPFRIEIPFTADHWEAWWVAGPGQVPLARGWERQTDEAVNPLFYRPGLTAARYAGWLHDNAIRYVAVPDVALDLSATSEVSIIDHRPAYLTLVMRSAHWRVYAVADPQPIASGAATLTALTPDSLTLRGRSAGAVRLRVHFTPYWELQGPAAPGGCVAPAGDGTRLTLRRGGTVRLVTAFALDRIGARSRRCTGN